ncbi:MAG: HAD family hydrolase, partial [Elstera sp.]
MELLGDVLGFDWVFGGDAFARKKPDPLPLIETCRALGQAPAATLMVGDS